MPHRFEQKIERLRERLNRLMASDSPSDKEVYLLSIALDKLINEYYQQG